MKLNENAYISMENTFIHKLSSISQNLLFVRKFRFKSEYEHQIWLILELFELILKRLAKKSFLCYYVYRWRNLHKILKEHLILACWVLPINVHHLNHCWVRWFFYFRITNSNTISKRIMTIKVKIKKSFFDILSPPFIWKEAPPNY